MFQLGVCRLGKPLVNLGDRIVSILNCGSLTRLTNTYTRGQLAGNFSTETHKSDQRIISNDAGRFQPAASQAKALIRRTTTQFRPNFPVACTR